MSLSLMNIVSICVARRESYFVVFFRRADLVWCLFVVVSPRFSSGLNCILTASESWERGHRSPRTASLSPGSSGHPRGWGEGVRHSGARSGFQAHSRPSGAVPSRPGDLATLRDGRPCPRNAPENPRPCDAGF